MDKCKSLLIDFILERINEGRRKLYAAEEYDELFQKKQEAERDLVGDSQELRAKYRTFDNLDSQLELLQDVDAYVQGVKDAKIINEMLGL
jgi:hypothetical protein